MKVCFAMSFANVCIIVLSSIQILPSFYVVTIGITIPGSADIVVLLFDAA